jgi:hypothetical protein
MRKRTLVCASLLVPMLALAQPKTPDDWYKEGETQYNLGNFDKAADAFKQGFALESVESKKAAYLYNVAQAYRQGGKCKDAAFFYKRYLSMKDDDTAKPLKPEKRAEVEQFITEQEACAKALEANAQKLPNNTLAPEGTGSGHGSAETAPTGHGNGSATTVAQVDKGGDDGSDTGEEPETPTVIPAPKLLSARFDGGASKISAGNLSVPVQATFSLIAGYPVYVQDKLEIDAGIAGTFTPLPFVNTMTNEKKNAQFISVLADAGATYMVAPRIGIRGDLGVGVLIFGGISDAGNPFTDMGAPTSGALTMLAVRAAASADYMITPNVFATITPIAFSYSPAKAGLRPDISALTRLDFMAGIGYRM